MTSKLTIEALPCGRSEHDPDPPTEQRPRRMDLHALRALYFCIFGSLGACFPILPLLLANRGLDAVEISWVMVLIPASNLLVPPLWGLLADLLRARLWLLRVSCLGAAATLWLLLSADRFWGCIAAVAIFAFFRMPISSLANATVYRVMGGRQVDFSKVRLWGSVGFAIMVLTPGLWSEPRRELGVIATTSVLLLLAGLSTWPLPAPARHRERGLFGQLGQILSQPAVLLFLAASTVYYAGHSTYDAFFSLRLSRLGHSQRFIDVAWSIGVVVEILIMIAAPRFIHRVGSGRLLIACAGAAVARWYLLAHVSGGAALLAIQPFHGVTFGLWYLALVKHIQERAPETLRTSLQAVTEASMGLGMVVGYLGGGQLFEHSAGSTLFLAASGASAVALVLYFAALLVESSTALPPRR